MVSAEGQHSSDVFAAPNEMSLQVKQSCYNAMKAAFKVPDFLKADELQLIGMHSLWKLSATFARQNNCMQAEIEMHSQWKQQGTHVSMRYMSTSLPYQDAKVT